MPTRAAWSHRPGSATESVCSSAAAPPWFGRVVPVSLQSRGLPHPTGIQGHSTPPRRGQNLPADSSQQCGRAGFALLPSTASSRWSEQSVSAAEGHRPWTLGAPGADGDPAPRLGGPEQTCIFDGACTVGHLLHFRSQVTRRMKLNKLYESGMTVQP